MRHRLTIVLAASGFFGFLVGMVVFPEWQVAVETAQVLANVVQYQTPTPFFIYHTKLWTVLHQLLAVFLRVGVSEITLSLVLSGLTGMVSFQALSIFVFALSEDMLVAIGAPFVILAARASEFGVVYPILLVGSVHTYGVLGLSLTVLVIALFGAGAFRLGAFLLGTAPAIHPSLGLWLVVILGTCFVWDFRALRESARPAIGYFIAGCLITGVSLLIQERSAFPVPRIDPEVSARYLSAFVALWDTHRQPVRLSAGGVLLNVGALTVATLWLTFFRNAVPRSAVFLLRVIVVAGVMSLGFVAISRAPAQKLPTGLLILMPTRVANINAMTFVALLVGLLSAYRRRGVALLVLLLFSIGLLLGKSSMVWGWLQQGGRASLIPRLASVFDARGVLAITLLALLWIAVSSSRARNSGLPERAAAHGAFLTSARLLLAILFASLSFVLWRVQVPHVRVFENDMTSPVFREASRRTGLLLTGGNLSLVQLRTRRPVLLNGGGLDGLVYAIDSAPETERILRDVYGIDFFHPPEEARRSGMTPSRYNKEVWEPYTVEKWRAIRDVYQVSDVLTEAGWSLSLPLIAEDNDLRLYHIPER